MMQKLKKLFKRKDIENLGYVRIGLACTTCHKIQGFIYLLEYDFIQTLGWKFICKECQKK